MLVDAHDEWQATDHRFQGGRTSWADGHLLDAAFDIDGPDDHGRLTLILGSAGGASGSSGRRNHDYPQVLAVLLSRLATADAALSDA